MSAHEGTDKMRKINRPFWVVFAINTLCSGYCNQTHPAFSKHVVKVFPFHVVGVGYTDNYSRRQEDDIQILLIETFISL
jgi:hypothetical protein